jgi:hypothetical protein
MVSADDVKERSSDDHGLPYTHKATHQTQLGVVSVGGMTNKSMALFQNDTLFARWNVQNRFLR